LAKELTNKKILLVSQYFWPEDFRVNELVAGFKNSGCEVEVLTSSPNYPSGSIYPDFKKNPNKYRKYNDVPIHRVPQFSRGKSKFKLVINYVSFVITASLYSIFCLRKKKFDIIFTAQLSPIFSTIPAILCKRIFKAKLFFWVLDIWPDSLTLTNINIKTKKYKLLEYVCSLCYSYANILFISSKGFQKPLHRMGISKNKIKFLPNWVEESYGKDLETGSFESKKVDEIFSMHRGKKIFLFAGNIGEAQNFSNLLKSFKNSKSLDKLAFLIIGDGRYKKELDNIINLFELNNHVFTLGRYESKFMPYFFNKADILVFSLLSKPIFELTLPGKVQSYMSSGKPILGMIGGEAQELIKESICGFTSLPDNIDDFSLLIDKCTSLTVEELKILGNNGRKYSLQHYDFNKLVREVVQSF
jgi:colanic acid biosynthesis glycosyl transferase WcaI